MPTQPTNNVGNGTQPLFSPICALPTPQRFSVRAAAAGDMAAMTHWSKLEEAAIALQPHTTARFDVDTWHTVLKSHNYPPHALDALVHAMMNGASLDPGPLSPLTQLARPNHGSLYTDPATIGAQLEAEVAKGWMARWPMHLPTPNLVPMGAVRKFQSWPSQQAFEQAVQEQGQRGALNLAAQDDFKAVIARTGKCSIAPVALSHSDNVMAPCKTRRITDARFGVNDRGDTLPQSMEYDTLRSIIDYVEPGDNIWVDDLTAAYRQILLIAWMAIMCAVSFGGEIFVDFRLPFGANLSPHQYFAMLGHPLLWLAISMARATNTPGWLFQYVDDHIGVVRAQHDPMVHRACFREACNILQVPFEQGKSRGPGTRVLVLGIYISTVPWVSIECPDDKLAKIRHILSSAAEHTSITHKSLESVLRMIAYVAICFDGAQVHSADLMRFLHSGAFRKSTTATIPPSLHSDLEWWSVHATHWNGQAKVLHQISFPKGHAAADARGFGSTHDAGIGVVAMGCGFYVPVPTSFADWSDNARTMVTQEIIIAKLELIALALLFTVMSAFFPGSHIPCITDNTNVLAWMGNNRGPDAHVNFILRFI